MRQYLYSKDFQNSGSHRFVRLKGPANNQNLSDSIIDSSKTYFISVLLFTEIMAMRTGVNI